MFFVSFYQCPNCRVGRRPKGKRGEKIWLDENAVTAIFNVQNSRDPLLPHRIQQWMIQHYKTVKNKKIHGLTISEK
jgi:hypothetical protein